jgi:SulP family sulfate permease
MLTLYAFWYNVKPLNNLFINNMIALFEAYKTGRLKRQFWLPNLISGLIVGIVALPLAMAFAIASGARPEQGLYTAIVAGFLVSVFGGSQLQIAGPTGAFIVILAGISAKYGIVGLQLATVMAGFILIFMGLTRLGTVIKYIPEAVIVGFTAGIGVIIFVSQWKDFLGLQQVPAAAHFHEKLFFLVKAFPQFNLSTTALGMLALLLLLLTPKFFKRIPAPLLAMLLVTLLQLFFHFDGVATIGSTFGGIPQQLPQFQGLPFSWIQLAGLIGPAFSIALLGAIESLLCAVVADNMAGTRHDSNQELIGQGIANIFAPLFGGFAATGAIARTATNIKNGGSSPLSGMIHALVLVLIIVLLAPWAAYIPLCALAAILFIVAYNMSEMHRFLQIIRYAPIKDTLVLATTFLLTVFADLVVAVCAGVILAYLLKFIYVKQADV